MKVLHVLDHSLPYFSGYSFRSDAILRAQQQMGWQPVAITSPKHEDFGSQIETINGIDYHRTRWPSFSKLQAVPMARQIATVAALAKEVKRLAAELKVDLIHAHSPSPDGLAAARAARALNLPLVYELRYYEEDAAVDRGKTRYNSLRYRLAARMEQQALEQANCVTTISQGLRDDLMRRGIAAEKIFVVPNGVDAEFFSPCEPDTELVVKHGLSGKTVIGFVGSFYFYEGLETLVDAVTMLLAERSDVKLMLVGEGEGEATLRQRIPEALGEHFIFAGNVPHGEVRRYYSVMDILVYPRRRTRLTELTTPLKPLEAMAVEKVIVGSDVGGLRELFGDGDTGYLVAAENEAALAQKLQWLAENPCERQATTKRAREFVTRQRDWQHIVESYVSVYDNAQKSVGR